MSPEQIAAVTAAGDSLRADPRPWSELTAFETAVLKGGLLPHPSFSDDQRNYLQLWWLEATPSQITAINKLCPPDTDITGRDGGDGKLYLSADILSDALEEGRLKNLLSVISKLTLVYKLAEDWPKDKDSIL